MTLQRLRVDVRLAVQVGRWLAPRLPGAHFRVQEFVETLADTLTLGSGEKAVLVRPGVSPVQVGSADLYYCLFGSVGGAQLEPHSVSEEGCLGVHL